MTVIRLGLHLHPPPRRSFEAFVNTVKRAVRCGCEIIPTTRRSLLIAALIIILLSAHAASALAAQARPLIKVVVGYGSTDGGVTIVGSDEQLAAVY